MPAVPLECQEQDQNGDDQAEVPLFQGAEHCIYSLPQNIQAPEVYFSLSSLLQTSALKADHL